MSGGHETGDILRQEVMEGGRIEVWQRADGVWGVSLLPNYGHRHYPGVTFTPSKDAPDGFPSGRQPNLESVLVWALELWQREGFGERVDEG